MLHIALCSFCTTAGKYFGKFSQHCPCRRFDEWLALTAEDVAGIRAMGEVLL